MSNQEEWAKHVEQLKTWGKSIAEYARVHNLNKARLYYWRNLLSKTQKVQPPPGFIPIKIKSVEEIFSLKIKRNELTFELSGLSLSAVKELISMRGGFG